MTHHDDTRRSTANEDDEMRTTRYPWGDEPMPAEATGGITVMSRTDSHGRPLCAGTYADGTPCDALAAGEMTFDGISYCTRHGNRIIKRQQQERTELQRYREYQESAFGAVVHSWSTDQLNDRLGELAADAYDTSELHNVRLQAETKAINLELQRRRATV
jgi:hypothetical protein